MKCLSLLSCVFASYATEYCDRKTVDYRLIVVCAFKLK